MLPQPPESQESIPAPDVTVNNFENTYSFRDLSLVIGDVVVLLEDYKWEIPLTLVDPEGSLDGTYIKANVWFVEGDHTVEASNILERSVISPNELPGSSDMELVFYGGMASLTIHHTGGEHRWFPIIEINGYMTIGPQITLGD